MTFKQVVKRLKDAGWVVKNQKGSHLHMIHAHRPGKITIPYKGKRDLRPGTLHAIEQHAGLKF
jgi:predicted RNA binding protein YcfA (HicA-like mRNA interferase family)